MSTRYPSRHEVSPKIQPDLDLIDSLTVRAEYAAPSTPGIDYHEVVGEKSRAQANPAASGSGQLLDDHFRFLNEARNNSSAGLKRLYDCLHFGVEKGNRILRELKALRYVVVREVRAANQKGGRSRLIVTLTAKGEEMLNGFDKLKS